MRGFRMLVVATVLVPLLMFGAVAVHDRARLLSELADEVRANTDIFYQHALNVFETHYLVADRIAIEIAGMSWDEIARSESLRATLAVLRDEHRQVQAISLDDATGQIRTGTEKLPATPISVADRDYFQVLRAGTKDRSIGALVRGRLLGRINFNLGRRLALPDGSFNGAIVTTVYPDYFHDFWASVAPQPLMVAVLIRADGMIMMRIPAIDPDTGMQPPSSVFVRHILGRERGSFRDVSTFDGIERFFSFRKIGGYDAYILHGVGIGAALQVWYRDLVVYGSVCAAATIALLGLALLALHRAEREHAAVSLTAETELARAGAEAQKMKLENLVLALARAEHSVRVREAQYRALAENSSDVIIRTGLDGIRRYVSPSVFHLSGYQPEELVGRPWTSNLHPDDHPIVEDTIAQLLGGIPRVTTQCRTLHKNGLVVWVEGHSSLICNPETGAPEEIITIAHDITARKQDEATLAAFAEESAQEANTDGLTGLANRRCFDRALGYEWQRVIRSSLPLSLLMLDADCFKLYNDHYGHPMGDQVLRAIAASMQASIKRPDDLGARYGGEEFAVILPNTVREGAIQVAETIRRAVAALAIPHEHGPAGIVTVSIGAASVTAASGATMASLLASADQALYAAKAGGRNQTRHADMPGAAACCDAPLPSANSMSKEPAA